MQTVFFAEETGDDSSNRFSPFSDIETIAYKRIGALSLVEYLFNVFPYLKSSCLFEEINQVLIKKDQLVFINSYLIPSNSNMTKLLIYLKKIHKYPAKSVSVWSGGKLIITNVCPPLKKNTSRKLFYKNLLMMANKSSQKINDNFFLLKELYELLTISNQLLSNEINVCRKVYKKRFKKCSYDKNCWVGNGVQLDPSIRLVTTKGPIVIGSNSQIGAFCYLEGPLWVGNNSFINHHSLIKHSVIGDSVKIGGEVSSSVVNNFSNKVHYGFLGNSYVGKWVNIGAGTTTSNLKNNYRSVSYVNHQGKKVDSKQLFLGAMLGDYSKTGINSSLSPGIKIGVAASVRGQIDRNVESFRIFNGILPIKNSATNKNYIKFSSLKETLEVVFQRRDITLGEQILKNLQTLYQKTVSFKECN